ncbi:MAG: hypothetical protein AB7N91_01800 [Candidatus Tectimicrobiota bacterium]
MRYLGQVPGWRWWRGAGVLLLLCAFAGCVRWTHASKSSTEFTADAAACEADSLRASTAFDGQDTTRQQAYLACLQARGWSLQDKR